MRGITGFVLGCVGVLAGCLRPSSKWCADDGNHREREWWCPDTLACEDAPTYCGMPEPPPPEMVVCDGKQYPDSCSTDAVPNGFCASGVCQPCTPDWLTCDYGDQWVAMSSGTIEPLHGLWIAAPDDVYAVGENGTLLRYDGLAWSKIDVFVGTTQVLDVFGTIWGVKSSTGAHELFVAVFGRGLLHFDGARWEEHSLANQTTPLTQLWGTTRNNIFAVGDRDRMYRFTGMMWEEKATVNGERMRGIWGRDESAVVAVAAGMVRQFASAAWPGAMPIPVPNADMFAVWAGATGTAYAVGKTSAGPAIYASNDLTSWIAETTLPVLDPSVTLSAVGGTGGGEIVVGGSFAGLLHLEAGAWVQKPAPAPAPDSIAAIAGAPSGDVFAVGAKGAILRYRRNAQQAGRSRPASESASERATGNRQ